MWRFLVFADKVCTYILQHKVSYCQCMAGAGLGEIVVFG